MKKQKCLLVLAVLLCLSGCSSMLQREYLSVTPNVLSASDVGDETILQAEDYQDLITAISYFVTEGSETGTIRLYNYTGDVDKDLTAACLQVTKETPMGAYAVDYIKPTYSRIVSYYEAVISISYRRTPEQIASIISVSGISALREALKTQLPTFPTEVVFQVSYLNQDVAFLEDLVSEVYYDTPAAALGTPTFSVSLYPATGAGQHIVEISILWTEDSATLQERYAAVTEAAAALSEAAVTGGQSGAALAQALHAALWSSAAYHAQGGSTAYDALVVHTANSRGMALAYETLCDLAGLNCIPVEGYLYNDPYYWCIVSTDDGYRHVNVSGAGFALKTDNEMVAEGYAWNQENYPDCGDNTG